MAEIYIGNNQIGGGTTDLSNYYNKSEIDSSFGETYLVKITNASGYYCYVPRTMSASDRQTVLSKLNTNGGIVKTASTTSAFIGTNSNQEGRMCQAKGDYSHAEGDCTTASGYASHAEGYFTTASGSYSHAEGYFTIAQKQYQHVEGKFNADASNALHIIGNGTGAYSKHNALEVHLSGEMKISDTHATGEVYEKPMFVLQDKLYQIDSSITALEANSGGGGGSQPQYISLEDYDTLVDNDAVDENTLYYIQDLVDTSTLSELVNTSTLSAAINNATSALAPCEFVSLSEYQDMYDNNTVDSSKIYIISDLATQSDFSDFVSYSSLSALVNAVDALKEIVTTESLILDSTRNITPELYIRDSTGNLYQLDIDELCQQFGTLVQG